MSILSSRYENGFGPTPFVGMGLLFARRRPSGVGKGNNCHIGKARRNRSDGLLWLFCGEPFAQFNKAALQYVDLCRVCLSVKGARVENAVFQSVNLYCLGIRFCHRVHVLRPVPILLEEPHAKGSRADPALLSHQEISQLPSEFKADFLVDSGGRGYHHSRAVNEFDAFAFIPFCPIETVRLMRS